MNSNPKVSIITPSFNQAQFIEETILSVLNQEYPNIEYIIIDGGSTDNTLEIIKNYQDQVDYWVSEPDNGQTDAIIKGFEKANGKYVTWLCSDDILEPSAVKIQVEFMEHYSNCGLVYGDRTRIDDKGNIIGFTRYPEFRKYLLKWGYSLPQETVLIRQETFKKTSGLDPKYQMAMDYDLWCKLAQITDFCHIPRFLGRFRSYNNNKSAAFSKQLKENEFSGNLFNELIQVHYEHFDRQFPYFLYNKLGFIRSFLAKIDKHSKINKEKLSLLDRIAK